MVDVFSKAKRSEVMSRIRSRGNKSTELRFGTLLRSRRISGWRRHSEVTLDDPESRSNGRQRRVRPDYVFLTQKVAVFIDGCFWHSCPRHCQFPTGHREFWVDKLRQNKVRDRAVDRALRARGWLVMRIWEHELRPKSRATIRLERNLERLLEISLGRVQNSAGRDNVLTGRSG